jgi:hypothetical protein
MAGNDDVIEAALSGPAILSGMADRDELETYRQLWRRARHPVEVDRAERLSKALDDTVRGGSLLIGFLASLTDPTVVARAEASEVKAAQASIDDSK